MIYSWLKNKIPHCTLLKKRMNEDIMIVCASTLVIYYLNETAAYFVNSVDDKSTIEEIKKKFMESYNVSEDEIEHDFVEMIRDLKWKKILTLE